MTKISNLYSLTNYIDVNSNGNVVIAAPTSGLALDVNGTGRFTGALTLGAIENISITNAGQTTFLKLTNLNGGLGDTANIDFSISGGGTTMSRISSVRDTIASVADISLAFSTFNVSLTEKMRILGNGNVGIGTASPIGGAGASDRTLSINSGAGAASFVTGMVNGTRFSTLFTSSSSVVLETNAAIPLAFNTNGTERLRITSSGNVGIGTTSPKTILSINGGSGAYPTLGTNVTNSFFVGRNDGLIGTYFGYAADGNGWIQQMRNDSAAAGNLILQPVGGNVGIGTTAPSVALHVLSPNSSNHPFIVAASSSTTLYTSYRYNSTTDVGYIGNGPGLVLGGSSNDFGIRAENNLIFAISNSERMRITSGGNVGIGTTSPSRSLDVTGTGRFTGTLSTKKVEMGEVATVGINTNSSFTLLSSDKINIRTNILVSVSIYWDNNYNAQRQYLLFLGATDTGWGTPNSAISVVSSNDWSSGYVGAATFSMGGSGNSRTLNISVSGAATYNVTAFARVLEM